jgi:hypothetical protein
MNYRILAAAAAISISALGSASCSDDDPAGPSGPPTTFVFTSALTAGNEVPPITNAESTASGTVTITMNVTRDASGAITAATTTFACNMTGFTTTSAITIAHIHNNVAGQIGGIFVNTGLTAGEVTLTNGAGSFTKSAVNTTVAQAEAIIANPAGHYFNVHSSLNQGGAIRGQLVLQ